MSNVAFCQTVCDFCHASKSSEELSRNYQLLANMFPLPLDRVNDRWLTANLYRCYNNKRIFDGEGDEAILVKSINLCDACLQRFRQGPIYL
jgi:hypothetical protein